MAAAEQLAGRVSGACCVDALCRDFLRSGCRYRDAVCRPAIRARVAVEALHADYWYKFVGLDGRVVGMTSFGESAPGEELMKAIWFHR